MNSNKDNIYLTTSSYLILTSFAIIVAFSIGEKVPESAIYFYFFFSHGNIINTLFMLVIFSLFVWIQFKKKEYKRYYLGIVYLLIITSSLINLIKFNTILPKLVIFISTIGLIFYIIGLFKK